MVAMPRSEDRRAKEEAMHARFARRIETALQSLERRLEKAQKPVEIKGVQRQIGRLLQRNQRAAKLFEIQCDSAPECPSGLRLRWQRNEAEHVWAELTEGCYVLRTNIRDWTEQDVWQVYIQLTQVEGAFRIHKDQLEIRPVFHQKKERVRAHILVCFLSYVLWKML